MRIETHIERAFNELISLLRIDSAGDLFFVTNGKLKPYSSLKDFGDDLSNFYDEVLTTASNVEPTKPLRNQIVDNFEVFIVGLRRIAPKILSNLSDNEDLSDNENQ